MKQLPGNIKRGMAYLVGVAFFGFMLIASMIGELLGPAVVGWICTGICAVGALKEFGLGRVEREIKDPWCR